MNFKEFIRNEGFKKLALTRLNSASFSILIYLFNEILSGVDEIISSRKELSILMGWSEKQICEALDELQFCNMIHVSEVAGKPLRIKAQLSLESWNTVHHTTSDNKKPSLGDATNVHSILPNENAQKKNNIKLLDLNIFDEPIPFPKRDHKIISDDGNDFPFSESTLNDLGAFREKTEGIDSKIRALASNELNTIKLDKRTITPDEELLLQILIQHHQPKKQLIFALRSDHLYPNLHFFLDTVRHCADIPKP